MGIVETFISRSETVPRKGGGPGPGKIKRVKPTKPAARPAVAIPTQAAARAALVAAGRTDDWCVLTRDGLLHRDGRIDPTPRVAE